jgi:nucleoid-associated protein YgaU
MIITLLLMLAAGAGAGVADLTYDEYQLMMKESAKRETDAKGQIAAEQARIVEVQQQDEEAVKAAAAAWDEIHTTLGITPADIPAFDRQLGEVRAKAGDLQALPPEELVKNPGALEELQKLAAAVKSNRVSYLSDKTRIVTDLDNTISQLQARRQDQIKLQADLVRQQKSDAQNQKLSAAADAKARQEAERAEAKARKEAERAAVAAKKEAERAEAQALKEAAAEARRQAREQQASAATMPPLPAVTQTPPPAVAGGLTTYRVHLNTLERETLRMIAAKKEVYGNAAEWQRLYEANRPQINENYARYKEKTGTGKYDRPEDYILPGQVLTIPR